MNANGIFSDKNKIKQTKYNTTAVLDRLLRIKQSLPILEEFTMFDSTFQIGVFSPSPRSHYLNITPNNVIRLYYKDSEGKPVAFVNHDWTDDDFKVTDQLTSHSPIVQAHPGKKSRTVCTQSRYWFEHTAFVDPVSNFCWSIPSFSLQLSVSSEVRLQFLPFVSQSCLLPPVPAVYQIRMKRPGKTLVLHFWSFLSERICCSVLFDLLHPFEQHYR